MPHKSITLLETSVADADGNAHVRKCRVGYERCIGCGLCESKCPITGLGHPRIATHGHAVRREIGLRSDSIKKKGGPWPSLSRSPVYA